MTIIQDAAERFAERMRNAKLRHSDDEEVCHIEMDYIMCETLRDLGFDEGVKIFEETDKWYA